MHMETPRNGNSTSAEVEFSRDPSPPRDPRSMANEHQYYVYMVSNRRHTVLYIGVTNSLERRMWQHKAKTFSGFTKKYNCDQLVYFELYERIAQAISREKQLKGWIRA